MNDAGFGCTILTSFIAVTSGFLIWYRESIHYFLVFLLFSFCQNDVGNRITSNKTMRGGDYCSGDNLLFFNQIININFIFRLEFGKPLELYSPQNFLSYDYHINLFFVTSSVKLHPGTLHVMQ